MTLEKEQNLEQIDQEIKRLVIVFWNPGEPLTKAATSLHIVEKGQQVDPKDLRAREGISIKDFFKDREITIQEVMEKFPHCIEPVKIPGVEPPEMNWDYGLIRQTIPTDEEGLQELANFIGMEIESYVFDRFVDEVPQPYIEVEPRW